MIWLGLITVTLVSIILHTLIHEAGHLLAGWSSGYRFVSFRVLNMMWARDADGKIRFWGNQPINAVAGQCLMEPDDEENFKFIFYNLGGGLANLIFSLPLLPLLSNLLLYDETPYLFAGLFMFFTVGVSLAIVNLRAKDSGGMPVDGLNIKTAKESPEARYGFYLMLKMHAIMATGKTYKDLPPIEIRETQSLRNYFTAYPMLLKASQLEELGHFEEAYALLKRIPDDQLPKYYQGIILLSRFFLETVYLQSEESLSSAQQNWAYLAKDKKLKVMLINRHPAFLPYQVGKSALIDHDFTKAKNLLSENRKRLSRLANKGHEKNIEGMLQAIEIRMNALKVV
ncbi:MAG: hypothetical protein FWF59_06260 [Turicibacter sp.]|nr:hypothetical protein [Turicibacter sp.]